VLTRFELGEDVDKFADVTIRQRLAGIYQRFVVGNPGLSLGQFVYRRAGSDDLRDHGVIDRADRLYRRRLFSVGYRG
jgi:hypothetical protein